MTQPNQSERERFVDSMWNYYGVEEAGDLRYWGDIYDSVVEPYITANYTPNTEVAERERVARLDTARRARVLYVINQDGTGGQAELGFEVALDKVIPYSEYLDELTKAKDQPDER